jgi:DNA polymerase/3'-5' exonuclease PolX
MWKEAVKILEHERQEMDMTELHETLIDINQASLIELTTIRGIGPGLAERIIANRPYEKVGELVRVPGINETKLLALTPFITLGAKKTQPAPRKTTPQPPTEGATHVTKVGETETFVFLEDRNERQDALLIIFGGFILGLLLIMLRRSNR